MFAKIPYHLVAALSLLVVRGAVARAAVNDQALSNVTTSSGAYVEHQGESTISGSLSSLLATTTLQCGLTRTEKCTTGTESSAYAESNSVPSITKTRWSVISNTTSVKITTTVVSLGTITATVTQPQSQSYALGFCFEPNQDVLTPCTALPAITSNTRTSAAIPNRHNPLYTIGSKFKTIVDVFKTQFRGAELASKRQGSSSKGHHLASCMEALLFRDDQIL